MTAAARAARAGTPQELSVTLRRSTQSKSSARSQELQARASQARARPRGESRAARPGPPAFSSPHDLLCSAALWPVLLHLPLAPPPLLLPSLPALLLFFLSFFSFSSLSFPFPPSSFAPALAPPPFLLLLSCSSCLSLAPLAPLLEAHHEKHMQTHTKHKKQKNSASKTSLH